LFFIWSVQKKALPLHCSNQNTSMAVDNLLPKSAAFLLAGE
jgi:hypothetical protein